MIKPLSSISALVLSFYIGRITADSEISETYSEGMPNQYSVVFNDEAYFLQTPGGFHRINEFDQVGSIYYRMSGLMHENPRELRSALRSLKNLHELR
jgi:hypothetical protein